MPLISKASEILGKGLVLSFFLFVAVEARATSLRSSADLMAEKSWAVSLYGESARTQPKFHVDDGGAIPVNVSGGSSALFSGSNTDVKTTANGAFTGLMFSGRPGEGLQYRIFGSNVEKFRVAFASGSSTNELSSESRGGKWGAGVRWNLTQATRVSTAFALDASYARTDVSLDRYDANGVNPVDFKFYQDEYQVALNASRRFGSFDPYAGVKIARLESTLEDRSTRQKVSGRTDIASGFVGLKYEFFEKESAFIEGSLGDERGVSAGVTVSF